MTQSALFSVVQQYQHQNIFTLVKKYIGKNVFVFVTNAEKHSVARNKVGVIYCNVLLFTYKFLYSYTVCLWFSCSALIFS